MVTVWIILILKAVLSYFCYVDVLCWCSVGFSLVVVLFLCRFSSFVDENYLVCRLNLSTFYYNRTFAVL